MKFDANTFEAIIHKRYKRFLSDIELPDGSMVVAHVPNTGSMKTCWDKGWKALITHNDDPKRKLKYTLQCTHNGNCWIGVNTSLTNKLVHEALEHNVIEELDGYKNIKPEKKIFDSRIDFYLSDHPELTDAYVEVKNVTLAYDNHAYFPDAVTTRGQKHLKDLIKIKEQGMRAIMLYILNRTDAKAFSPAKEIDPTYANLLKDAERAGVEILVYQCKLTPSEIKIHKKVDYQL